VVSEHLYKKHPDMNEGVMSKTRAIIVQTKTEARAATELHFNEIIKIGDSVKYSTGIGEKILEDAFEAFIGAVYLDQGEKKVYEILKRTVIHYYEINSLKDLRDFKSLFQELMQKYSKKAIKYKLITNKHSDYAVEV
jgi:ribonuclease-3